MTGTDPVGGKSTAVVDHAKTNPACTPLERELDTGGLRMPAQIGEALLSAPIDRECRRAFKLRLCRYADGHLSFEPAGHLAGQGFDCDGQTELRERARMKSFDHPAQLRLTVTQKMLEALQTVAEVILEGRPVHAQPGHIEPGGGEHTAEFVMQFARKTQAGSFCG